jgi:hypothetical protein
MGMLMGILEEGWREKQKGKAKQTYPVDLSGSCLEPRHEGGNCGSGESWGEEALGVLLLC